MLDYRLYIPLGLIALGGVGYWRLWRQDDRLRERHAFAVEYTKHLHTYALSSGSDTEAYGWLVHRSSKMQSQMGAGGVYAYYKPPYANYQVSNYPIVLNSIPEVRQAYSIGYSSNVGGQIAEALQESLIRHIGLLEDVAADHERDMKNPIVWLREGVRLLMASPLYLLQWLGLLGGSTVAGIANSRPIRLLAGTVTLIGLVGSIVTIVVGWDEFIELLTHASS